MILDMAENDDDIYEDYTRNASEKIKGVPKNAVREIVFVPDEDITLLYNRLMEQERYKEATLLGLLYDSGCRKNEIAQVTRSSITEDGNSSNIVKGKRGKQFRCLYFSRTKEAFKKYNATRTDDLDALFINAEGKPATVGNI